MRYNWHSVSCAYLNYIFFYILIYVYSCEVITTVTIVCAYKYMNHQQAALVGSNWEVGQSTQESDWERVCWEAEQVCNSHIIPAIILKELSLMISKYNTTQSAIKTEQSVLVTEKKILIFWGIRGGYFNRFNTPTCQWNTESAKSESLFIFKREWLLFSKFEGRFFFFNS